MIDFNNDIDMDFNDGGAHAIPIFAEIHTNPYMQTAHIMGGIGVKVTK